ncbi:unnamed protein product [Microthlaspi erraticum]|uniref:TFIIS central domain-containing protein n=1 Tax=Microthlaspi erraticum TaxID=1685480 RepID=A0A6D2HZT5_9BRAS|nr:unnamed protein product [Microthlaspi erraticum]
MVSTGDSKRDKVREILQKSLSKVADEIILFNIGDSNNPDLRRKVLTGEISGERLVTMEREEMGSDRFRSKFKEIKEKARFKEENRLKSYDDASSIRSYDHDLSRELEILTVLLISSWCIKDVLNT